MNNPQVAEQLERLKDKDIDVRRNAAEVLGKIGDASAIPALIEALKDRDKNVRSGVTIALLNIGDVSAVHAIVERGKDKNGVLRIYYVAEVWENIGVSAVPALIEALKNRDWNVRYYAVTTLGRIGDASAIPMLRETMKDQNGVIRRCAVDALAQIGDVFAVPALIEKLKNERRPLIGYATGALEKIGDNFTLPRKILAASIFSAQQRMEFLDALRRAGYPFPDTFTLCQTVLHEQDAEARNGAQTVLNWLNGDQDLLIASQPDTMTPSQQLLRAAQGRTPDSQPDILLRTSDKAKKEAESPPPTLWERFFGKRKHGAS